MKKYSYAVNAIRKIDGNVVTCNVLKYRVYNGFGSYPILTSLSKWKETPITLNEAQEKRFREIENKDERKAYLTMVLALS